MAPRDTSCRVCGEMIGAGDPALFKDWEVRYAHPACGWEVKAPPGQPWFMAAPKPDLFDPIEIAARKGTGT